MEDILGYIIIFGIIITFTWIYFSKKEKGKRFLLTKKIYSFGNIEVYVIKKGSDIECLFLNLQFITSHHPNIDNVYIELISDDRSFNRFDIPDDAIRIDSKYEYCILFDSLSNILKREMQKFSSFRFVVLLNDNKKLKSGSMAFNKHLSIFVPDTGTYN